MSPGQTVIELVAHQAGLRPADLLSESRRRRVAWPRQRAMYVLRQVRPDYSYPRIARILGRGDHTTAMHAIRAVEGRMAKSAEEAVVVQQLVNVAREVEARRLQGLRTVAEVDLEIGALESRLVELRRLHAEFTGGVV